MRYVLKGEKVVCVKTVVEADSAEEAQEIARERDIILCGLHNTDEFFAKQNWVWYEIGKLPVEQFTVEPVV